MSSNGRHKRLQRRARARAAFDDARRPIEILCSWGEPLFCESWGELTEAGERAFRKRVKRWNRRHPNGQLGPPVMVVFDNGASVPVFDTKPKRPPTQVLITNITGATV